MLGQHGLDKNDRRKSYFFLFQSYLYLNGLTNFLKVIKFFLQDRLFLLKYLCLYSDAFDINNPFEPVPHPISRNVIYF